MSTSGNTPPTNPRIRPTRVAPRRSTASAEPPASSPYDSHEFPVLLRMPDVSPPRGISSPLANEPESAASPAGDEPHASSSHSSGESRKKRHSRRDRGSADGSHKEPRHTAQATASFWSTIPPQIASGGMLLAVIGLCVVFMRSSGPPAPVAPAATEWSGDTPARATTENVANTARAPVPLAPGAITGERPAEHSSVASKPTIAPSDLKVPATRNMTGSLTPPRTPPSDREASVPAFVPGPVEQDAPVQGWPAGLTEPAEEEGTELNAPLESARIPTLPAIRVSQRETRSPSPPPLPRMAEQPQLQGTVEIPPPTQLYQQ